MSEKISLDSSEGKEYLASAKILFSAVVKEHYMAFYRLSV